MMTGQATCSWILLTLVVIVLILGACDPFPLAGPERATPTPSAAPPGPSVADLLRDPPAPGETVEVDAYSSRGGAPVFPSPYPPPNQVRCPDSHNATLTDWPFPAILHLLNGSQTNILPNDAPWLVATIPEATQPAAHTEPQLPYHARLRGRLGHPAFAHCPHADRILVVEDVVTVYAEEPPEPSPYRLQLPDDYAAWPRYRDAALGYSLPHPPDWTIEPLAKPERMSAIALHAPQWPDYPAVMRVHAGETHHDPYSSSRPPLLQGGGLGLFEQGWVFGEESTTTQHLAGYRVDRTSGPGERAVSVLFSAHGRTYELALRYPTGLNASQPLLTAYSAMIEGFQLDVPPGPTPTPPVKQTLGTGPFLSQEEAQARVPEHMGQEVELLSARLMSEAEARFGGKVSFCDTFMGHRGGVWVLTVRGVFEGTLRTMRLLLDATTGETLCGEEINPEATPYATMPPATTATPVSLVSQMATPVSPTATLTPRPTATPAPYSPPTYPATPTPWLTANRAPYPPPATATRAPTSTPMLPPTPAPPRLTPLTPLACRAPTPPSNESETVAAVVTTLSCRANDFDYLADQLRQWLNLKPTCPPPLLWTEEHDLDSDGRGELIAAFALPSVAPRPSWAPCALGLSTWAVLGHRAEGYYLIRYRGQQEGTLPGSNRSPQLVMVRDINGDGHVELVIQSFWSGAATDFTMTTVGQWDGQVWQTLGYVENTNVDESRWDDLDGDGRWEFVVHGNTVGLASYLERRRTDVYGWREGGLELVRSIPDPDDHPYFLVLDANAALAEGEMDRALALALRVVQGGTSISDEYLEKYYGRIVAYAAIEAMLVHALRHEPEAMTALLYEVETKYGHRDNPYAEAARRLWLTYQATQDPLAACETMERMMREHGDINLINPLQFPGMAVVEALTIEQICPLDDGLTSWPPTGEKP